MNTSALQQVVVLGSTGSIGVNTLDVLSRHKDKYQVFALTANKQVELLAQQCATCDPLYAVIASEYAVKLQQRLKDLKCKTEVLSGKQALSEVAEHTDVDTVMAAIVGGAGLPPTMAAVKAGKKVLLANKEALVMAGRLFMDAVAESGAQLLPIDSEHNAIFQCLPQQTNGLRSDYAGVRKILLTGSGGPFRQWSEQDIRQATPDQACNHPNWSMGRKISVDSASLMNKGLEFIEAKWLFNVDSSFIDIVIHPQSIIHSMVEYLDGSILAQLGHPDMRTPIAYGLAYPERIESGVSSLDLIAAARLDFESPDIQRFPVLELAMQAADSGIGAATVLNASNEIAVDAFLNNAMSFGHMTDMIQQVMQEANWSEPTSLDEVIGLDSDMREYSKTVLASYK